MANELYDPNILIERKIENMIKDTENFYNAATSQDNCNILLQAIKKVVPDIELTAEDLSPLTYNDRSTCKYSLELAERFGLQSFDFNSILEPMPLVFVFIPSPTNSTVIELFPTTIPS